MCGRFAIFSKPQDYLASLALDGITSTCEAVENYNAYPTQYLPVIYQNHHHELRCDHLHWGLIPGWSKDTRIGFKTSNARSETAADKPSFRHAFKQQRCLIPVDGWYEWKREGRAKQPYYHHRHDQQVIWLGGLWENWMEPDTGESIRSFTILTQAAQGKASQIHNRMPVLINPDNFITWLDNQMNNKQHIDSLMQYHPETDFEIIPVSTNMNSPQYNNSRCIEAID